jgi:CubicO group peptidase (beta-lactamase class C family)
MRIAQRALASCLLALVSSRLAADDADWRRQLDPATGYTSDQARRLHEIFQLATWQTTTDNDYARYTLQRTTEFFPTAVIARAGAVKVLPHNPRLEIGKIRALASDLGTLSLDEFLEKSQTDAWLVIHRGTVVYERHPRMSASSRHLLWSVSKTFAGLLVAQLEAEHRVDVKQPIESYIPELARTEWGGTSVTDILDQASGMDALEVDASDTWDSPDLPVFQYESSLGLLKWTPAADRSTYEVVASMKRLRASGERFEYSSVNTFVLGWLVERITGQAYADVVTERIWSRIGAEQNAALLIGPRTGAPASHGGIIATLRDVGRYGMLFTPSWRTVAATPVVPEGLVQRIQRQGRPELLERAGAGSRALATDGTEAARYPAWQWDAVWGDGDLFKAGFRGQGLYISPAKDLVIAFFSSAKQSQVAYARALARSGLFR